MNPLSSWVSPGLPIPNNMEIVKKTAFCTFFKKILGNRFRHANWLRVGY
jgi:hypothetical protein